MSHRPGENDNQLTSRLVRHRGRRHISERSDHDAIDVRANSAGGNQMAHLMDQQASEPNRRGQQTIEPNIRLFRGRLLSNIDGKNRSNDERCVQANRNSGNSPRTQSPIGVIPHGGRAWQRPQERLGVPDDYNYLIKWSASKQLRRSSVSDRLAWASAMRISRDRATWAEAHATTAPRTLRGVR